MWCYIRTAMEGMEQTVSALSNGFHISYSQCGDKQLAVLVVPGGELCFDPPAKYSFDGVTEKVKL